VILNIEGVGSTFVSRRVDTGKSERRGPGRQGTVEFLGPLKLADCDFGTSEKGKKRQETHARISSDPRSAFLERGSEPQICRPKGG